VGLFFVFDRLKHPRAQTVVGDSLHSTIEASLLQVQHQIWLLRNVLWWYLLPLVPGITAFLVSTSWQSRGSGVAEQIVIAIVGLICAVMFWYAHRLNQREIRVSLEPRRVELEELRTRLSPSPPPS
jgi:hypothetical protein